MPMAPDDPKPNPQPEDINHEQAPGSPPANGPADSSSDAEPLPNVEELIADVSPDAQESVQEFMAEAAKQNEAANEAVEDVRNKPGPYIAFEHVNKSFGDLVVLKDVSFSVLPGETLCILGRSGVGKSVSLQILMGFLKPDSGKVMVAGED
ncbi:MAG TPA: ATP-binding cassette domain-containing protein, partial [Acidobacteriaceae bacterium]|nr:ATP-binding cassette domain-containing protein [Acidobacteriaceae bacterium]